MRPVHKPVKILPVLRIFLCQYPASHIQILAVMVGAKALIVRTRQCQQLGRDNIVFLQQLIQLRFGKNRVAFIEQIASVMADTDMFRAAMVLPEPVHTGQFTEIGIEAGDGIPRVVTKKAQILSICPADMERDIHRIRRRGEWFMGHDKYFG